MHDRKKAGTDREVKYKKEKITAGILLICIVAGLFLFINYRERKVQWIFSQQKWLDEIIAREKQWILENQGEDGEIYMNGSEAGNVDPYFSCLAAEGLLAKTESMPISQEALEGVRRYLNWHTEKLLETDGKMGIYRKTDGTLDCIGKADSEDGYLGVYLELLGKYLSEAGTGKGLENWKKGVTAVVRRLKFLTDGGTTQVSGENSTVYLMDNLEVWKGLYTFENSGFMKNEEIIQMREVLEEAIPKVFWDEKGKKWKISGDNDQYNREKFYPDGIAQIAPLIFGFPVKNQKAQKKLYREFTEEFRWQDMKRSGFAWTMTGMAAVRTDDRSSLAELIRNYEAKYSSQRKYPLYTGEAGWISRECEELYKLYEKEIWF